MEMQMLNADFTMCYKDVLRIYPNVTENISFGTSEQTKKLLDMLYSKYAIYEISGETIQEFKLYLENKFNQYKDYYLEMISAYETQVEWLDGLITQDTYDLHDTSDEKYTPGVIMRTTDSPGVTMTDEHYDLPRSSSSENRPSSRDVSTPSGSTTRTVEPVGTNNNDTYKKVDKGGTVTRTHADQVEQRDKYLKSIRNLYSEFADKFKPCFLDMWL